MDEPYRVCIYCMSDEHLGIACAKRPDTEAERDDLAARALPVIADLIGLYRLGHDPAATFTTGTTTVTPNAADAEANRLRAENQRIRNHSDELAGVIAAMTDEEDRLQLALRVCEVALHATAVVGHIPGGSQASALVHAAQQASGAHTTDWEPDWDDNERIAIAELAAGKGVTFPDAESLTAWLERHEDGTDG